MRVVAGIRRQPAVRIPLDESWGSVLAEEVVAPLDLPPWDNSAMDGYAARAEDVRRAATESPIPLRVVEQVAAGGVPARGVGPGEAIRVATGGRIPAGADSVIRQEDTDRGYPVVTINSSRDAECNIRRAGEDISQGSVVAAAGTELTAAYLGLLAAVATTHPLVYRRPRVGILASGDELAPITEPEPILSGQKIANSNTHTLIALVKQAGAIPIPLGIATDTAADLRIKIAAAADCDLLITTAGVSVGERDLIRPLLTAEFGLELDFWRLRIRPGAPAGFGTLHIMPGRTEPLPWIGLPGNPVSTMVTFELLARPAIRKLMGQELVFRRALSVTVSQEIALAAKLQHFLRAKVRATETGGLEANLTGPQGSGILSSMALANALLIIPEGQTATPPGAVVKALVLDDPRNLALPPW